MSSSTNCRQDLWYSLKYLWSSEWFYKIFDGNLFELFWSTFLHQIFSYLCFCLQDFIKTVRLLLAALSVNGLINSTDRIIQRCIYQNIKRLHSKQFLFLLSPDFELWFLSLDSTVLLNIPIFYAFHILLCITGLVIYAFYSELGCDPLKSGEIRSPNQLLPLFVVDLLSVLPGLPGLFVAALISGALR